ncbi:class I SAM-dependent methyltransferase [Prosthecobacter sp.]|uniref:class I SAM-dependent methyltransferase n=1 Tax=Prosthecobacter sp. TaxID=1965333 RepID=UPI002AB9668D|nr:class I SAM-dependent methyltransferase [Prosthecobacter sp.]MDZ4403196.1 class I SAM-dependent methyltransferase [Prosthecobacter sp.]
MPASSFKATKSPRIQSGNEFLQAFKDHEFDQIYPEAIRRLSTTHWSPVNVCRMAAQLLVVEPGTKVLDIGCGPGKFCVIGATTTKGHFTGVEQREKLARIARDMVRKHNIPRADIVHGNTQDVNFRDFDAFYLFNPFQENILPSLRIDYDVELEPQLYTDYTAHVQQQLMRMPMATRVVTYCGDCTEIPDCYACVKTAFNEKLKLWVKKHPAPDYARPGPQQSADDKDAIPSRVSELVTA